MDAIADIEGLVEHAGRGPGTDAERRAANHLAGRLEELDREVDVEPTFVRPNWPLAHVVHALLGIVGSVLAVGSPALGAAIALAAVVSAFGDLTGSFMLVRRLGGRRASQNVVSRERGDKPGTLVLVAHYDAARTGAAFAPRSVARRARLGRLIRRPIGPFEPYFWSLVGVFACAAIRIPGVEALALTIVQFGFTVVLIVSVPLIADVGLSGVVPGANDNASGVATVLRLADRYGADLDYFDLWVLFPGAEEALTPGMRAFLKRHKRELDRTSTIFVNLDMVGSGTVRYARKEGLVLALRYHPTLVELCEQIAAEDAEGDDRYGARPFVSRSTTDANAARAAGYPAIRISCLNELDYAPHYHQPTDTPDRIDPEALERAFRFCSELIELIDERIGPKLERAGGEVAVGGREDRD